MTWLTASGPYSVLALARAGPGTFCYPSLEALISDIYAYTDDDGRVDVVELMGGEARTTQCLIRRRFRHGFRAGKNFDMVCGIDLTNRRDIDGLWCYLQRSRPLVVVISPPCAGMKGWSALNSLSGEVAWFQFQGHPHLIREHPQGTELNLIDPWPAILADSRVVRCTMHQCATLAIQAAPQAHRLGSER